MSKIDFAGLNDNIWQLFARIFQLELAITDDSDARWCIVLDLESLIRTLCGLYCSFLENKAKLLVIS